MEERWLVELTKETLIEADHVLKMDSAEFIKEYGCEHDRVDKERVAKAQTLVETLLFFINKTERKNVSREQLNG